MSPKAKAKIAARLAAANCPGITRRQARELIHFWLDCEAVRPSIPVEQLVQEVREYMTMLATPSSSTTSHSCPTG